jgi:hypothetical protein
MTFKGAGRHRDMRAREPTGRNSFNQTARHRSPALDVLIVVLACHLLAYYFCPTCSIRLLKLESTITGGTALGDRIAKGMEKTVSRQASEIKIFCYQFLGRTCTPGAFGGGKKGGRRRHANEG